MSTPSPYSLFHLDSAALLVSVVERALDTLLADLRRRKYAETASPRPRKAAVPSARRSRHVPHAVRREVAARDGGQCTYVDPATGRRCTARAFLQLHHDETFARGGGHEVSNVRILCAAHNALLAEQDYGAAHVARRREATRAGGEHAGRDDAAATRGGGSLAPGGSRPDAAAGEPRLSPGGSRPCSAAEAPPWAGRESIGSVDLTR